jgi:hypothetical protein
MRIVYKLLYDPLKRELARLLLKAYYNEAKSFLSKE